MKFPHPRLSLVLAASVAALMLADPASFGAKKKDEPDVVADARAFAGTDRDRAIKLLEQAIADNPTAENVDTLMVNAGEQRRLSGDAAGGKRWFVKVISHGVPGPDLESAKLGSALCDAVTAVDDRVMTTLQSAPEKDVLDSMNADRYLQLAVASAKVDDTRGVSTWSKKAITYARGDDSQAKRITTVVASLTDTGSSGGGPDPLAGKSPLDKAEALYRSGDREGAKKQAEAASASTQGDEKARADGLLANLNSGPEDPNKIAVILPLSGKWQAVGESIRDAIKFGYENAGRQLVFIDTLGTAEGAVAALDSAVKTEHAIAVVGPILTDETDLVISEAENLHVPLLSLSQSYEDTTGHYWALSGMYTKKDQVEALVSYAMGPEKGMTSFAMFTNDSPAGVHAAELFKKAVEAKGGTIATAATYSNTETSLVQYAKQLGLREGDLATLRQKAKEAGGNPDSVVVPPVINFQGIFIPDTAVRTPLACAALAYEEFPMGDFTPHKGMTKIPLLGLSGWNNPNLPSTGNEYTRSSIFTDVFSSTVAGDADPFVTAYRAVYSRAPTAVEAATVDAAKLLAVAANGPAKTRPAFRDALLAATTTTSITGATKFNPQTLRASREMQILTVNRTTLAKLSAVAVE
jgi:ABC-type branched-subunit amino acid transport system substrate-binding protein